MAVAINTSYPPPTTSSRTESIVNKSEPKLDSQEFETVQVQKTRDHPLSEELQVATIDKKSFKEKLDPVIDFVFNDLLKYTTCSSVAANLVSAPLYFLLNETNPIKKIINSISMFLTKLHLAAYSTSGLKMAIENKNPLFVFSYAVEALAALFGLRQIYLFRGIASGIDGMAAVVANSRLKQQVFSSYKESWNKLSKGIWDVTKEVFQDPQKLFNKDGVHKGVISGYLMSLGALFGMTVNDYMGSTTRDLAGGVNDYALTEDETSPILRKSGWYYLAGTVFDLASRWIFNDYLAKLVPNSYRDSFIKMRDTFHELAIAGDRVGQYYFLKGNETNREKARSYAIPA